LAYLQPESLTVVLVYDVSVI